METEYTVFTANRGTPIVFRVATSAVSATNTALAATTGRIAITTLPTGSAVNFDGTVSRSYSYKAVTT